MRFLIQLIAYGCVGVLLENLFTGFHTLIIDRNPRATTQSFLWMLPIYGLAGTLMAGIHQRFNGLIFVILAVLHIYLFEFASGFLLKRLLGRCPWEYSKTRYSIMGLIRLDYCWVWLGVAIGFDRIVGWIERVIRMLSSTI